MIKENSSNLNKREIKMIISNDELLDKLRNSKNVFLIEPPYKRQYMPIGLAKISTYVKKFGGKVSFGRTFRPLDKYLIKDFDLICVTSLYTYKSEIVIKTIKDIQSWNSSKIPIILGGVCASLLTKYLEKQLPDIYIFNGYSKELDLCCPDYNIDWKLKPKWKDYSYIFTSRGCPNDCSYCGVKKLEPDIWINPKWREHIQDDKSYIMISDNNISSQPFKHFQNVCKYLIEKGKKVVFNNGFDCKHITPKIAELISKLKFVRYGLRLAFDRISDDKIFQKAIRLLQENGISNASFMAFVLFNFNDTPKEATYRAEECVKLNIRPYPQQYTPLNSINRENIFVGKYWTKNLIRTFRYFFLMRSIHTKYKFNEWLENEDYPRERYNITDKDIEIYNNGFEK